MNGPDHQAGVSRRSFLAGSVAVAVGSLAGPTLWRQAASAAPAMGTHLTFGRDPRSSMTISWSTAEPVASPMIDLGTDAGYGLAVPAATRIVAGTSTNYHHAVLSGLDPSTTYRYRVRHDGVVSDPASFVTAPAGSAAGSFTFTAFGDQGVNADAVATTTLAGAQRPAFHLHAGDLCYAYSLGNGTVGPTDQAVWDRWFTQISAVASHVPWMPAVGNHEMEVGYGDQGYDGLLSRFVLPDGGPSPVISSFRYGNVAVLNLDANDASTELTANRDYTGGAQERWLDASLATYRADPTIDFIIAQFHHCSFCTNAVHASDGGVRERWSPLFDRHGVDLVINGHNHCYERTHPIRDGVPTAEVLDGGVVDPATQGTTYVTAGGGGQAAYQTALFPLSYVTIEGGARVPEEAPWSATRYLDVSLLAVDVKPPDTEGSTTMTLRALGLGGRSIETVTLRRVRARAGTPPVASQGAPPVGTPLPTADQLPRTGSDAVGVVALGLGLGAGAMAARLVATSASTTSDHQSIDIDQNLSDNRGLG